MGGTRTVARTVTAQLPCGPACDGSAPERLVGLRPIGPEDDFFLIDTREVPAARRATALLARCLDDEDGTRSSALTIGDREALLLQLRACSLGEQLDGIVTCPRADCRTTMEFRLRIGDLLLPPYDDRAGGWHTVEADGHPVAFRLPRVGDLEIALAQSPDDAARAHDLLLARCVDGDLTAISGEVLDRVTSAMAELDPQAELQIELACTECGQPFWFLLDTGAFLLDELDAQTQQLVWEVHQLASHYHWSEAAILAMPAARRSVYLQLIERMIAPQLGFDEDTFEMPPGGSALG